jgi:vanillate monooxygenase
VFLKNAWYVACTPDEIAQKPLGRTICGEAMVFYRAAGGVVAALEDFCPHRGAPLSLGFVRDGTLVCGYHAWKWAATARLPACRANASTAFRRCAAFP